jgi:hypothetical protein
LGQGPALPIEIIISIKTLELTAAAIAFSEFNVSPAAAASELGRWQWRGGRSMSDGAKKPKQPLSTSLATVGGITFLMVGVMVIGPLLYGKEAGELFHVGTMLIDGVCAVVGAALGFLIGRLIEGPPKKE